MTIKKNEDGKLVKVASIVWTIDPDGVRRFLLRHNKPFNGHDDEWTIVFGGVEPNEPESIAAKRETQEEYGLDDIGEMVDLNYSIEYEEPRGKFIIFFFSYKVKNIDTKITLNEESIGFDWVTLESAKKIMQHNDEFKALEMVSQKD